MTPKEYLQNALRTESLVSAMTSDKQIMRLLHAALGLATESGEFVDAVKRRLFYEKSIDVTNMAEEIGDILWYCAIAIDALNEYWQQLEARSTPFDSVVALPKITFESIMSRNIAKLRTRYPEKFDADKAVNRDLSAERASLEDIAADTAKALEVNYPSESAKSADATDTLTMLQTDGIMLPSQATMEREEAKQPATIGEAMRRIRKHVLYMLLYGASDAKIRTKVDELVEKYYLPAMPAQVCLQLMRELLVHRESAKYYESQRLPR